MYTEAVTAELEAELGNGVVTLLVGNVDASQGEGL